MGLLTDLYQLTMAYGYWKLGMHKKEAAFHLHFRRCPFNGGFAVAAGLDYVLDFIERFRFDDSDIQYLSTLKGADDQALFSSEFLDYLLQLDFSCDVHAVPEGTVVFPYEPLVRVTGPILQAQILETPLLNLINFQTLIATRAARVHIAARGDPILEFGLRRAQGIDGGMTASRAAFIGGCSATSNVMAGKLFGIPVAGTQAHSWVMAFDDEQESFQAYAEALPNNCVFLVDTYDSLKGVEKAIEVGKWLKEQGYPMLGIRLDSGDLNYLSIEARRMLDAAGFEDAKIVASNDLDEYLIDDLKRQGAQIATWGVGTSLVTAKGQAALDGVYKLSAIRDPGGEWQHKVKLSEQMVKISNPGILNVRRYKDDRGYVADALYSEGADLSLGCEIVDPMDATRRKWLNNSLENRDLLLPIFQAGKRVYDPPALPDIRSHALEELEKFHGGIKRFLNPHQYVVGMEKGLFDLKISLIKKIRGTE